MIKNLVSFHILEREGKQQSLMTWTYPTITEELKTYISLRCFPTTVVQNGFFYLRKNRLWIYVRQFINKSNPGALIVIAVDLVPTKYKVLCDILVNKYIKSYNPVDLVKLYLNLITSGSICYQENGTEILFDLKKYRRETQIKDLISSFGLEIILIFNAILLKRRILVYHPDIEKLQEKMIDMTSLVSVRNPNDYLQPLIESTNELKGKPFYLAGSKDETLNNEKYYDLYVNLISHRITISKEAKDCLAMTKIHRDIAHFLVQLSESSLSETKVIEEINVKTNDILEQLNALATCKIENKKMVSITDLKAKKFNPPLENFLINLAVAENIMLL